MEQLHRVPHPHLQQKHNAPSQGCSLLCHAATASAGGYSSPGKEWEQCQVCIDGAGKLHEGFGTSIHSFHLSFRTEIYYLQCFNLLLISHDYTKEFFKKSCVFSQRGNNTEILCKAATIAREGQNCYRCLEGIYHNLLSLVWGTRAGHKVRHNSPCTAHSPQASPSVTIFYSPTTVSSPAQAAEPKPAPASFLTAPFSHSRSHVLWQQAAPPH